MRLRLIAFFLLLAGGSVGALAQSGDTPVPWDAVLDQEPAWYATAEAVRIADNVLAYQDRSGGWPKNIDMARPLTEADRDRIREEQAARGASPDNVTIDNGATHTQIRFLASAYAGAEHVRFREGALRGLDYLLDAQYDNGGWPQFFPLRGGYYDQITFNDDAMVGVLALLRDVARGEPAFAFVDAARRERIVAALDRGIDAILRMQVRHDGRLTAWCAQHDRHTLAPAWARAYEPPSLSGGETVGIVRFLMGIEAPSPAVIAAVEGAVAWLQDVAIRGYQVEAFTDAEGRSDRRLVADPDAAPLWARFYELGTNRPIFLDRDSVVRYAYSEIGQERRRGYAYYGRWAETLLVYDYPAWRSRLNRLPVGAPWDAVVASDFIFDAAPFRSCHAATIAETESGLVAAWFGGSREAAPDVGIWLSRHVDGRWTPPVEVANGQFRDRRYSTWNPVLFQPEGGPLMLFYKSGPRGSEWFGVMMTSDDAGVTWSAPRRLPDGILGPIKNKPIQLANGDLLAGSSTEDAHGWRVHVERSSDGGRTWTSTPPLNDGDVIGVIQPTLLTYPDGRIQMLGRTRSEYGALAQSWSSDDGRTWSPMERAALPNNNSGVDGVTLADGHQLLVYNHSTREQAGMGHKGRGILNVAVGRDGQNWQAALILEYLDEAGKQFSYPAVIQTRDGQVHIVYTWHRERIKHIVLDPERLSTVPIRDGAWPAEGPHALEAFLQARPAEAY